MLRRGRRAGRQRQLLGSRREGSAAKVKQSSETLGYLGGWSSRRNKKPHCSACAVKGGFSADCEGAVPTLSQRTCLVPRHGTEHKERERMGHPAHFRTTLSRLLRSRFRDSSSPMP